MATFLFVVFVVGILSFIVVQLCARLIHHRSRESIVFSTKRDVVSWEEMLESLVYFTKVRILRSKKPFGGHGRIEGVCEASHRFIFWPFRVKRELVYFDSSGMSSCEIFLDDGGFPFCYQEVKQKLAHGLQASHDDEVLAVRSVAAAKLVSSVGNVGGGG